VVATTVAAPIAVTALPANHGILVNWTPPADTSRSPVPGAVPASSGHGVDGCLRNLRTGQQRHRRHGHHPSDLTEVCSAEVDASQTSVRLAGLVNDTSYTVAVVSIDLSGGVSALLSQATATPQPTEDSSRCTNMTLGGQRLRAVATLASGGSVLGGAARRPGRRVGPQPTTQASAGNCGGNAACAILFVLAFSATAQAQITVDHQDADWPSESRVSPLPQIPDWGVEIGVSLYRPAVDSEFNNGAHPLARPSGPAAISCQS